MHFSLLLNTWRARVECNPFPRHTYCALNPASNEQITVSSSVIMRTMGKKLEHLVRRLTFVFDSEQQQSLFILYGRHFYVQIYTHVAGYKLLRFSESRISFGFGWTKRAALYYLRHNNHIFILFVWLFAFTARPLFAGVVRRLIFRNRSNWVLLDGDDDDDAVEKKS